MVGKLAWRRELGLHFGSNKSVRARRADAARKEVGSLETADALMLGSARATHGMYDSV